MLAARKQRLFFVIILIIGASIAVGLALYALQQNINLFYTPTQVDQGLAPKSHIFRVGGIVERGSIHHAPNNLNVQFVLTDNQDLVTVDYNGILPTLFRDGQGIVALGHLNNQGIFIADQILAKHDENYMPPEVAQELKHHSAQQ